MNSVRLSERIVQCLAGLGLQATRPQLQNLGLLCGALAFGHSCHLASLALDLPVEGQRDNLIQRLRRWLKTEQLKVGACYAPFARQLVRDWQGQEICLVMDRTDIKDRLSILMLGMAYHKRVLPLAWQVLRFGGTGADEHLPLLKQVLAYLPAERSVSFFADSEFRTIPVQRWCHEQGWHCQVGLHRTLTFRSAEQDWCSLQALDLQRGERRYLQGVYLSEKQPFGPVNLIADWAPNQEWPRYWALDLPADAQAWRRGRKRYWIEPTFRDWKGYGFDVEATQLNTPARLERLLLAVVLTSLWMIHVGQGLVVSGRSQELAATDKTDYSLFRLGRDYLQRARTMDWRIPVGFRVTVRP